jgi:hypothetical protein
VASLRSSDTAKTGQEKANSHEQSESSILGTTRLHCFADSSVRGEKNEIASYQRGEAQHEVFLDVFFLNYCLQFGGSV